MVNTRARVGKLGEDIACKFLVKRKFKIVERNYRKPWGELDIVAEKNHTLHFVEVKTVSREIKNYKSNQDSSTNNSSTNVSCENFSQQVTHEPFLDSLSMWTKSILTKILSVDLFQEGKCTNVENVSDETNDAQKISAGYVCEGRPEDIFRPEDNVFPDKLKRLSRTIQTYLMDNSVSSETKWEFGVITVLLDEKNKMAKVNFLEDLAIS